MRDLTIYESDFRAGWDRSGAGRDSLFFNILVDLGLMEYDDEEEAQLTDLGREKYPDAEVPEDIDQVEIRGIKAHSIRRISKHGSRLRPFTDGAL